MEVLIKPILKSIEIYNVDDNADTISTEAVITLCDKLLDSSFVILDGVQYTSIKLPEFIYSLNKRFGINLSEVYKRYEDVMIDIINKQHEMMDKIKEEIL